MTAPAGGWTENSASGGAQFPWREVWAARELIGFFALRDLRVRYKQAILGVAWVVVQPLITVAAFTLVFDRLTRVETGGTPYPVFALSGLLGWSYISQVIGKGSDVLVGNSALVTKVYFPRIIAPVASLLPSLVDLGVGLVLLVVLCLVYGVTPGLALLLLPCWLALLALSAIGPVCLLAALNVRFRDVRQLTGPVLQALLFLSPVAYSSTALDGSARLVYSLNPFVGVLEMGRWVLVGAPWPGLVVGVSTLSATLLAVTGLFYFQHASRSFADVI